MHDGAHLSPRAAALIAGGVQLTGRRSWTKDELVDGFTGVTHIPVAIPIKLAA